MDLPSTSVAAVSVALSTYNGARYLREQLDSLLAQRGVALDIVAVDDGSTDATPEILAHYADRDARITWHANAANLGPTRSFERAMSLCHSEFVAPCDQDDYWEPDKLRLLHETVGDADLAYCDSSYMDEQGVEMGSGVSDRTRMLQGTRPVEFLFGNSVSGHASLVRRSLLEAAQPFPDGVYHDWWLALVAAGRNGVRYLPRRLVRFRRHGEAFSTMGQERARAGTRQDRAQWLQARRALAQAYASRGLRDSDFAMRLHADIERALCTDASAPLLATLWTQRQAAPHWTGIPAVDVIRLWSKFAKKLHRARAD